MTQHEQTDRSAAWLPIALVLTIGVAVVAAISQQWRGGDSRAAATSPAPVDVSRAPGQTAISSLQTDGRFQPGSSDGGAGRRQVHETLRERLGQREQARARADLMIVETDHDILPNGDLEVTGRVKNNGTVAASQVRVRVRIIGNDGLVAAQSESEIQPGSLAPGTSAPFTAYFQYRGPVGTISTEIVWSQ